MKEIFYFISSIGFLLLGFNELVILVCCKWIVHDTPEAAMSGVFALLCFYVADKLHERV